MSGAHSTGNAEVDPTKSPAAIRIPADEAAVYEFEPLEITVIAPTLALAQDRLCNEVTERATFALEYDGEPDPALAADRAFVEGHWAAFKDRRSLHRFLFGGTR